MSIEETKAAASSDASAVVEHSDDDATKVFVSRLPLQWTDAHLKDHFTAVSANNPMTSVGNCICKQSLF
jgi:hypothetical protein